MARILPYAVSPLSVPNLNLLYPGGRGGGERNYSSDVVIRGTEVMVAIAFAASNYQ